MNCWKVPLFFGFRPTNDSELASGFYGSDLQFIFQL